MYTASTSWKVHFSTVMNRGSSASRLRRRRRKNHVGNMRFQQRWPSAIRRLQAPLTVARDVQRDRGGLGGRTERETRRVVLWEGEGGVSFRCVRHPTLRDTPQGLGEPTLRAPSMAISFGVARAICSA